MTDLAEREAEQRALEAGFTKPSVTQDQINALQKRIVYRFEHPEGTTATFAHAFLDGTFYLASGFSACVSPENYNPAVGEKYAGRQALEKATSKLWELEGYALFKQLACEPQDFALRLRAEKAELDDRLTKLCSFICTSPVFDTLSERARHLLREQRDLMTELQDVLAERCEALDAA